VGELLVDYTETYAPVAQSTSVRILLAMAATQGYSVEQMDVETAFLQGDLEETIYLKPSPGIVPPKPGQVWLYKRINLP